MSRSFTLTAGKARKQPRSQSEAWVVMSLVVATTSLSIFDLYRLLTLLSG
jgi:hypothetical protein